MIHNEPSVEANPVAQPLNNWHPVHNENKAVMSMFLERHVSHDDKHTLVWMVCHVTLLRYSQISQPQQDLWNQKLFCNLKDFNRYNNLNNFDIQRTHYI